MNIEPYSIGPVEFMYDGINSDASPIHVDFPQATKVAGYGNGTYEWVEGQWLLFPNAQHVVISVRAFHNYGDVLDVEFGDAAPNDTEAWIQMRKQAGLLMPSIYCNRSTLPAVRAGTGRYVAGVDYDIWCADWTGTAHQVLSDVGGRPYLCAATQFANHPVYDITAVYKKPWPQRCVL